mgnify:CR=1 FL=1
MIVARGAVAAVAIEPSFSALEERAAKGNADNAENKARGERRDGERAEFPRRERRDERPKRDYGERKFGRQYETFALYKFAVKYTTARGNSG